MDVKEKKIKQTQVKEYIKKLLELDKLFEDYDRKVKQEKKYIKDNGYLIDKKHFDYILNILSYSQLKTYINNDIKFKAKMKELYKNNQEIIFIPCEQKIFNNSKELIDNLSKNNEYIIINTYVWKLINNGKYEENEGKISFEIKGNSIIIYINQDEFAYFKHDFNKIIHKNLQSRIGSDSVSINKINNHRSNNKVNKVPIKINPTV